MQDRFYGLNRIGRRSGVIDRLPFKAAETIRFHWDKDEDLVDEQGERLDLADELSLIESLLTAAVALWFCKKTALT